MIENGLIQKIAEVFPQAPYQLELLNSFIKLFTNISSGSPQSRMYLVELGIFESVCSMVTENTDPFILQNFVYCLFSFFPQSRTHLSDEISSFIITPLKSVILRFIDQNDTNPIYRDKILRYSLLTIEHFATSIDRVHILIDEGVISLIIMALPQLKEGSGDLCLIGLEIISIVLSTLEPEVLEQILPLLDFEFLMGIKSQYICNIIEEIHIISYHITIDNPGIDPPVDPVSLIEAGALDLALTFIPDGDFKQKSAAATMLAAMTINLPESAVAEFMSNPDIVSTMTELAIISTEKSPLMDALRIIKHSTLENEEIAEIFELAGIDFDEEDI